MTGVQLPNGGILKTLHLPETVTDLTIRNQTGITDFVIGGYDNISTLRLENVIEVFDLWEILHSIPAGARVRATGLERSFENAADILAFYDRLDTIRGLDENGNNTEKAQVSGTFTIDTLTGNDLAEMQERYPNIKIQYNHFTAQVNFYAVSYTKISSGSGYIYVPAALVDSYKAAGNWQYYADQIRAIEDYPEITGGES